MQIQSASSFSNISPVTLPEKTFLRLYRYDLMIIIKSIYQISKVNLNVSFSLTIIIYPNA